MIRFFAINNPRQRQSEGIKLLQMTVFHFAECLWYYDKCFDRTEKTVSCLVSYHITSPELVAQYQKATNFPKWHNTVNYLIPIYCHKQSLPSSSALPPPRCLYWKQVLTMIFGRTHLIRHPPPPLEPLGWHFLGAGNWYWPATTTDTNWIG